jgi:hypothetical protein
MVRYTAAIVKHVTLGVHRKSKWYSSAFLRKWWNFPAQRFVARKLSGSIVGCFLQYLWFVGATM